VDAGLEDGDIARNLRHALVPVGLVGAVFIDSVMASVDHSSAHAEWAVVFFGVLNTALDNTRVRIISERTGGAIKTGLARARASASGQASGVAEAAGGALQPYTVGE